MAAAHSPPIGDRGARIASCAIRVVCVFAAVIVVVVIVALSLLAVDWLPFGEYNVTNGERIIGVVFSGWALAIAGLAWLVVLVLAWRKRHLRTRWLFVPPALVVAAGVSAVLLIAVAKPSDGFNSSRSEMEKVVVEVRSHPPGWSELYGFDTPREVGHVEVWQLSHRDDGVVVISDADYVFGFQMRGWAHSPQGQPTFDPGVKELEVNHLDGPWYAYRYVL